MVKLIGKIETCSTNPTFVNWSILLTSSDLDVLGIVMVPIENN
jgi:hypothetical protein